MSQPKTSTSPMEFKKDLGVFSSTMMVAGTMIGSGIFIVSADIARTLGSPLLLVLVWVISGAMTVVAALSYGEMAGMMPEAGGQYVYLREAYNPLTGFLFGWTQFLVIQTGSIAAVGMAFAKFTAVFLPVLGEQTVVWTVLGREISAAHLVAIGSIVLLSGVNMLGIREGKVVQDVFTLMKVAALLILVVLGIAVVKSPDTLHLNTSVTWAAEWIRQDATGSWVREPLHGITVLAALGVAMVGALFASDAWYNITFAAGEVKDPKRTVPISLVAGTVIVSILYVVTNVVYTMLLPVTGSPVGTDVLSRGMQFPVADRVGTAAAWVLFGAPAEYIMAGLIMISTFGCNNGMILAGARVYFAMARDGLFFAPIGRLNRRAVPAVALAVQGLWASALCLSGSYGDLLDYVVFAVLIFYIVTIIGVFRLRAKDPTRERKFRAPGYPVLQIVYILVAGAIAVDLLIFKPSYTWPGLLIVLLGVPVYWAWKVKSSR